MNRIVASAIVCCALFSASARAQGPESLGDISAEQLKSLFRLQASAKESKRICRQLGEYLTQTAHPTSTNTTVEATECKANEATKSTTWSIRVTYAGGLSNKTYSAMITIVVDVEDAQDPTVEKIQFNDYDNWIKPNNANLGEARKTINKLIAK